MIKPKSIKAYILFWISLLALGMSALLTYQGTQYLQRGLEMITFGQMMQAAELLPVGAKTVELDFGYHVADSWDSVPPAIKKVFKSPPENKKELLLHFENWWFFSPPGSSYFLLSTDNKSGDVRFISRVFSDPHKPKEHGESTNLDPNVIVTLWGGGSLVIFMLFIYRVLGNLAKPIKSLYDWAQNLSLDSLNNKTPDFRYVELNSLSDIINNSVKELADALKREKEFLGFASHELRTPIATLLSDISLLDKISPTIDYKEREVRSRIHRASLTMKGITETLLWLNKGDQEMISNTKVDIQKLLLSEIESLEYLLAGKQITLSVRSMESFRVLPEAAIRILITNIIRNAFQHAESGHIEVIQTEGFIKVENDVPINNIGRQSGFGLGLKLIRKIIKRFGWKHKEEVTRNKNIIAIWF